MSAEPAFSVARLGEIPTVAVSETLVWTPVRRHLGIEAFGVNAYSARQAGDEVVEDHDETGPGAGGHEELYFVAAGHAVFTVGGDTVDAPAGTFVFVRDPTVRRGARARDAGTTVIAVGGWRGKAYEVSPWEWSFTAIPHARAGDYERAAELMLEGLDVSPDNPALLYNLACYEALGGKTDDALVHLTRAFAADPDSVREWARGDGDLESIRGDARYPVD
jgi:hypothetical protein